MRQQSVIITLGVIQIIILTLFGLYFYRLAHTSSQGKPPVTIESGPSQGEQEP
ncbi:MAG: hypothetical protein WAV46_01920 [Candidatus Moraniibacteriota bacterium]